jgi:SPX domain protein involved in polyphosphate accumulation
MGKSIFQRFENKYIISLEQFNKLKVLILKHLEEDKYGLTTIQSLYFDTPSYLLIRRSIEKPDYKEKLRIRGYGIVNKDDNIFFEIKKKYDGIVYKRRVVMKEHEAYEMFYNHDCVDSQIKKEIAYFNELYDDLKPRLLMMYDRTAYEKGDLRITVDDNVRFRTDNLNLSSEPIGTRLLPKDQLLLEIKSSGAMPLWLVKFFSENKIYKTSFSKYGEAYKFLVTKESIKK